MNNLKPIRLRLGMTQRAMGDAIGCTQSNVGHYEKGQTLLPGMARKVIDAAAERGLTIGFDHVYGVEPLPQFATQPPTKAEEVSHG